MLWYLLIPVETFRKKRKTVHIMKAMGFIKPWKADKIVSLHIYLKIMMSLPRSKCKLSCLCSCFLFIWEQRDRDNNEDNKDGAERGALSLLSVPRSMPFLILATASSPHSFSGLTFGFAFLGKKFISLFSHFLNPHEGLQNILNIDFIPSDHQVVYSCWDSDHVGREEKEGWADSLRCIY